MKYRQEIDGLRALAVLPVILFHAGFESFSGGFVGVDVFFVISGYLISSILISELKAGTFSLRSFYERRARRILPALFLVMAVSLPFAWAWLKPQDMKIFAQSLFAVPVFSSNILFWQQSGYFAPGAELIPLLHTWSLAVEEQYYVFFPVFLMMIWKLGINWIIGIFILLFVSSIGLSYWGSLYQPAASFFLLPTRGWELLLGAFAAILFYQRSVPLFSEFVNQTLGLIGLGFIFTAIFLYDANTPFPGIYALLPTLGAFLIILNTSEISIANRMLSHKVSVQIGLISYSAYLWHYPIFSLLKHKGYQTLPVSVTIALCLLILPLSYLSWRFVERPFRNRNQVKRKTIILFSVSGSLVFLFLGYMGHKNEGNLFKYSTAEWEVLGDFIERQNYVWYEKDRLHLKPFDNTSNKVLIIGDSFSGDFINAFMEAGPNTETSVSSYKIPFHCGNLYVENNLLQHVETIHHHECNEANWYANDQLKQLIHDATHVIVASEWTDWQLKYLDKSWNNLIKEFGNKFYLVSTKAFDMNLELFSTTPEKERKDLMVMPSEKAIERNRILSATAKSNFINILSMLCPGGQCPAFTHDLKLISFDARHLTRPGARFLAKELKKHELLRRFFN